MLQTPTTPRQRLPMAIGLAVMLGLALPTFVSASDRQEKNLRKDAYTCNSFGARYGTPAYNDCMLAQQRRRDVKELESLEKTRLTSEIAREGQIMADRARKQRCDRNPDRRECRRAY